MSAIVTANGTEHASIRTYIFECTYPNTSTKWQDNPATLVTIMRNAFDAITNLAYKTIKVSNVRNSNGVKLEIHIDGIEWYGVDRLSASEVDALKLAIKNKIDTISNFTYTYIDIVCDRFLDNPSSLWTTSFEIKEGWN